MSYISDFKASGDEDEYRAAAVRENAMDRMDPHEHTDYEGCFYREWEAEGECSECPFENECDDEIWHGVHGTVRAKKGTFEELFNSCDEGEDL